MIPKTLIIYIQAVDVTRIHWLLLNENGQIVHELNHEPLIKENLAFQPKQIIVLVPTTAVLITQASLPPTKPSLRAQAALYAIEEQLIEDVQDLHAIVYSRPAETASTIMVVKKSLMSLWIDRFAQFTDIPVMMLPDIFLVPFQQDNWHIYTLNQMALVRINETQGFAVEQNNLSLLLNSCFEHIAEKPQAIIIEDFSSETRINLPTVPVTIKVNHAEKGLSDELSAFITQIPAVNLLQGEYQLRRSFASIKKTWRLPIILTGLWLLLFSGVTAAKYYYFASQQQQLEVQITDLYKTLYPQSSMMVSPRARIENDLQQAKNTGSQQIFLNLLNKIGLVIQKVSSIKLQEINFTNQTMNITVVSTDFQNLSKFTEQLQQQHLMVKQNNASSDNQKVTATYSISETTT